MNYRCRTKPNVSLPGCANSRWHPAQNKKMVSMATSLKGLKNYFQTDHLQPKFYQP